MKSVNSDIAYTHIRKHILSGHYRPGQPLMTKELSAEIGVSRTPVRDALRQLEADGLVIIRARLGASVKTMDFREFREICGLRLALETYAAGLAAENRTVDELREMKQALEAMRLWTDRAVKSPVKDLAAVRELRSEDVRFHIAIISAAKSELLKKEVLRLHIVSRVVSGPTPTSDKPLLEKEQEDIHRQEVQVSHDAIYRAIEKGDVPAAKAAMEHHIQDIIDTNMRMMARAEHVSVTRRLSEEELSYSP
ncbi:MAG: GntR family transcriptional regulator [Opitutaceae bacterium]|nr:GntR family transcriptional regulator [Opitutaceae bacterium]